MKLNALVYIFIFLIAAQTAMAVDGIYVDQAGFVNSEVACSENLQLFAHAEDRTTGGLGITRVVFVITVNGQDKYWEGQLTEGNSTYGNWTYNYNITASATAEAYYLKQIRVLASGYPYWAISSTASYQCTLDNEPPCSLSMSSVRTSTSNCTCSATQSISACTVDNIQTVLWTIPEGCEAPYSSASISCDYCDPLWTATPQACNIANYTGMSGNASKIYTSAAGTAPNGSSCCGYTSGGAGNTIFNHGGGSDCVPPPDDSVNIQCRLGAYLNKQQDGYTYEGVPEIEIFDPDEMITFTGLAELEDNEIPLVFDVDEDGITEVITVSDLRMAIYSYSDGAFTLEKSQSMSGMIAGSAIGGVDYESSTKSYECSGSTCSGGEDFYIVTATSTDIYVYSYDGSTVSTEYMVAIPGGATITRNSSFMCKEENCYIRASTGSTANFIRIDLSDGSVYAKTMTGLGGDATPNVPFYHPTTDQIYFYGRYDNDSVYIAGLPKAFTSGSSLDSEVYDGDYIGGALAKDGDIVFTRQRTAVGGIISMDLVRVSAASLPSSSFKNVWQGVSAGCISNPVRVDCDTNGDDIAIVRYTGAQAAAGLTEYLGVHNLDNAPPYTFEAGANNFQNEMPVTNFDPEETYNVVGTASITGISSGARVSYIDSNQDGQMELWVNAGSTIYVLDSSLVVLDTETGYSSMTPADLDANGITEAVVTNSTGHAVALGLTAGNTVEVKYSSQDPVPGITGAFYSDISARWNLWYATSTYAQLIYYSAGYIINETANSGYSFRCSPTYVSNFATDKFYAYCTQAADVGGPSGYGVWNVVVGLEDSVQNQVLVGSGGGAASGFSMDIIGSAPVTLFGLPGENPGMLLGGGTEHFKTTGEFRGAVTYPFASVAATSYSCTSGCYPGASFTFYDAHELVFDDSEGRWASVNKARNFYVYGSHNPTINMTSASFEGSGTVATYCQGFINEDYQVWVLCPGRTDKNVFGMNEETGKLGDSSEFNDGEALPAGSLHFFDFTQDGQDDMILLGTDNILRVYSTSEGGSSAYTSFIECYDDYSASPFGKVKSIGVAGSSCTQRGQMLYSMDSGYQSGYLLHEEGLIDLNTLEISKSSGFSGKVIIPADVTSDKYLDFVVGGNSYVSLLTAEPGAGVFTEYDGPIELYKLQPCSIDADTAKATVGLWVKAASTEGISYNVDWGDGTTSVGSYPRNSFTRTYTTSGSYTVTAEACDENSCDTQTCQLTAEVPEKSEVCSLGDAGEFNWNTDVEATAYGWEYNSGSQKVYPTSYGNIIRTSISMSKDVTCSANVVGLKFQLNAILDNADVEIGIDNIGSMTFKDGLIGISGGAASTYTESTSIYSADQTEYQIIVNKLEGKVLYYKGSTLLGTTTLTEEPFEYSIYVRSKGPGVAVIDYVRFAGDAEYGYTAATSDFGAYVKFKAEYIDNCEVRDMPENAYMIAKREGNPKTSYRDIYNACTDKKDPSKDDNPYECDLDDLRSIVQTVPSCYKQAMNYCVDVAYPRDRGTKVTEGQGVTACATILNLDVLLEKAVIPVANFSWSVVISSAVTLALLFFALIMFFSYRGKGGK